MSEYRLDIADENVSEVVRVLEAGLTAHAEEAGLSRSNLTISYRDQNENIVAGLTARETLGRMYVRLLWVADECRGHGLGRKMMAQMEKEAKQRLCSHIYIDTAGFQAPEFYERLGYHEMARFEKFMGDYDRIFYVKEMKKGQD